MVDGKEVGRVHVVQKAHHLINYERIHCHIEGCRLLDRTHPSRFKSDRMGCQTVEENPLVQEKDLI